ncbi:Rv3235 family protein [Streptomyces pseudogriseolus]|uniref:Rv3235 family protein n=1 Tax=Streptomyces pseudogriseolus TaxID=36817 RepID=UPI003FA2E967
MSRTPRRSPAAVPPRVPTPGAPLSPSPGAGRPRGTSPRRTRPADNRPAGRAPATRGSRASAGTGSPAGTPPEHLDGAPTALQPAQPPAGSRAESPASAPPEHPSGTLTCSTSARRDAPDGTPLSAQGRTAAGTAPAGAPSARPGRLPAGVPQPRPTDRFAELLVAVLSGQRPVHAMLRHSAGQAYDELIRLAERGPLRTRGARPVVRDIGWFVPREGAIEAFARIGAGDRLRAMAFRLERGRDLRWRCTAVELGGPR